MFRHPGLRQELIDIANLKPGVLNGTIGELIEDESTSCASPVRKRAVAQQFLGATVQALSPASTEKEIACFAATLARVVFRPSTSRLFPGKLLPDHCCCAVVSLFCARSSSTSRGGPRGSTS